MSEPHRYPPQPCPQCGYRMDASSAADGVNRRPKDGDWCLCLACGALAVFTFGGMAMRAATQAEKDEAWQDPDVVSTWQRIQQARMVRRDRPTGSRHKQAPDEGDAG